jgi:opacity protein-like surface antigen
MSMRRIVVVTVFAVLVGVAGPGVDLARAQPTKGSTPTATVVPVDRAYGEFTTGPTFGHTSSASFGGEGGYWFGDYIGVFGEIGHMGNVAGSDVGNHAAKIASTFNAVPTAEQPTTYFDAGVVVRMPTSRRWTPYALVGLGVGIVKNDVRFAVNGTDVTSHVGDFGVQLGGDLMGTYTTTFFTFGVGARVGFAQRWLADVSYRYGRVGDNSDVNLGSLSTNRLQFGVGARF